MFCPHCGNKIDDEAKFCEQCGAPVDAPDAPAAKKSPRRRKAPAAASSAEVPEEGTKVSPNITFGADGKYRWTYEISMFRNPTIFVLVWKVMFIAFATVFLFVMCLEHCAKHLDAAHRVFDCKAFGIGLAGMTVLAAVVYLLLAAVLGGKYIVDFTMDEKGVLHDLTPAQAKKVIKLAAVRYSVDAASGRISGFGIRGIPLRTYLYTEFARVKKVVPVPRWDLIKIRQTLKRNLVYALPEDFEFVLSYIRAHVPGRK